MLGKSPSPNWGTAPFCAVTGRAVDEDGWYNTKITLTGNDPNVWISVHGAQVLAREEGWASPDEINGVRAELSDALSALDAAVDEIRVLRQQVLGIEGLTAAGFEITKRNGRPPKTTTTPIIRDELAKAAKAKEKVA